MYEISLVCEIPLLYVTSVCLMVSLYVATADTAYYISFY